jgi:hypothetical protein
MAGLRQPAKADIFNFTMFGLTQTLKFFPLAALAPAGLLLRGRAR